MEDPSSFSAAAAAPHAAIPYVRVSASFSISGPAPSATAGPDDRAAAAAEMEKMLGEAAASLARSGRYIVTAAAIRAHLDELAPLRKMTILAPDDRAIADALYYESPPRFHLHIVPDRLLTYADLRRLPVGAELPTLDPGESLVLTSNGEGKGAPDIVRLNFVSINAPDLIIGSRIAVHGVRLPIWEFDLWDLRPSPPPSSTSSPSSLEAPI
ncbi:uncharacterized protein LOC109721815 [Ananas comosus]|uniref:Uncharacterized protein LOC109721815 n=1 Tax=Ananas comosus TaxID=4615 RepID=A0A6P5G998_ANACO|nr:uncharacterized protein LOC109721815 [Ananas comosus]